MNKIIRNSCIVIILLIIFLIIIKLYKFCPSYNEHELFNISNIKNKNRHIEKKDGAYAHFSKITNRLPSIIDYPLYYLSNPTEYTIKQGEFLYIPKNWWHWVVSIVDKDTDEYCFSCNHWFNEEINNSKPYIGKFISNNQASNIIDKLEKEVSTNNSSSNVNLWCDKNDRKTTSIKEFITNKQKYKDCYMITLNAYKLVSENKNNTNFFDKFKSTIPTPKVIKNKKIIETNFWLNNGNIDTGLHYDDYDGLLCVISGTKIVTLFHPSDTKYLYSYI